MPLEWHFCNLDCQVLLCWDSSFSLISLFFRSCQMNDISCQIAMWCQKSIGCSITIYWINNSQKCWGVVIKHSGQRDQRRDQLLQHFFVLVAIGWRSSSAVKWFNVLFTAVTVLASCLVKWHAHCLLCYNVPHFRLSQTLNRHNECSLSQTQPTTINLIHVTSGQRNWIFFIF